MAERFSRPYAEAVHGHLLASIYNATSRAFSLRMQPHDRPGNSVVRFNDRYVYPRGFAVSVSPTAPWSYADGRLVVSSTGSAEVEVALRSL